MDLPFTVVHGYVRAKKRQVDVASTFMQTLKIAPMFCLKGLGQPINIAAARTQVSDDWGVISR